MTRIVNFLFLVDSYLKLILLYSKTEVNHIILFSFGIKGMMLITCII